MNIVFFSRFFYPHIGGVETHVLEISKLLIKRGHTIIVFTEAFSYNDSNHRTKKEDSINGIKIVRISVGQNDWFRKFRIWFALGSQLALLKQADIIHCHDVFFWYLPFRFIFPTKPVYTTFHGFEGKYPISKKAILVRKISEKLSKGNICVGKFIEKWYGTKPNYVTYGGVGQFSIFNFQFSKKRNEKLKILFVGRLDKDTGILEYLKVLDELKEKKMEFEFEVCGDGEFKNKAERYGKVHGFIFNTNSYMQKADLVFASSYLSILQALANKKPVFAIYNNLLKKDYLIMTPFAKWIMISDSSKEVVEHIRAGGHLVQETKESQAWVKKQTWTNVLNLYEKLWDLK